MKNLEKGSQDGMENKIPYYDITEDTRKGYPFIINIGGRQIGKTYSTFKYIMDNDLSFVYLRRKDKHLKKCCTVKGNPFKPNNEDTGQHWFFRNAQETYTIYKGVENIGEKEEKTIERGIALPMSLGDDERGFGISDNDLLFYDEFIKKPTDRRIPNEADQFFNIMESINSNRELKGKKPLQTILLSNAVSIDSPIFEYLDLVRVIERMIKNDKEIWTDEKRGILIHVILHHPMMEFKQNGMMGRLTQGTDYYAHAYENKFAYDSFYNVKQRPIKEYTPVCGIDGIYIYRHKSNREYYVCRMRADCPEFSSKDTYAYFRKSYGVILREAMFCNRMVFADFELKCRLNEFLN